MKALLRVLSTILMVVLLSGCSFVLKAREPNCPKLAPNWTSTLDSIAALASAGAAFELRDRCKGDCSLPDRLFYSGGFVLSATFLASGLYGGASTSYWAGSYGITCHGEARPTSHPDSRKIREEVERLVKRGVVQRIDLERKQAFVPAARWLGLGRGAKVRVGWALAWFCTQNGESPELWVKIYDSANTRMLAAYDEAHGLQEYANDGSTDASEPKKLGR